MAVPAYTEDLTDIDTNLAESVTGYVAYGGGGAGLGAGPDYAMQGTNCVDKQITNTEKGILFNNAAGITMGAGDHTFIWQFTATPGITDLLVNRGVVVNIGNATTAFVKYHVEGSDTFGAGGRVAKCYVVDQTVQTANTGSIPYRTLVGSPNGTLQYFGSGMNTNATAKAANMGLDAQRYGTGAYITAGDVTTPATFAGFATQNDAIANRWGILTDIGGTLELQGYFVVGQNNAGTATLAYFEDSDVNINIADTVHSATDFSRFIFDHASTIAKWTNISVTAQGTNNRGYLEVIDTALAFTWIGGTMTGFGTSTLRDTCTADGVTWRGCDQVILLGNATMDNCLIDKSTATEAVTTTDLDDLQDNHWIGDGTGHAVDLGTIASTQSMAWNNTFDTTTYATVDGSTGNETILVAVNTGITLTINVGAGYTTPTIYNTGVGTVVVVSGQLTTTVHVTELDGGADIQNANVSLRCTDNTGDLPFEETVTITRSGTVATVTHTAHGIPDGKKVFIKDAVQGEYNGTKVTTFISANSYSYTVAGAPTTPATGTILATGVIINGLTDINGEISDTRAVTLDTPVAGWARKSSATPFFQQGALAGTMSNLNNTNLSALLISDE